ncbi:copper resistance protein CopC [Streptomyces oryzae]|uniref:Copper resistance protein CopC n=1 Tax=Streptomyces oryzae TaxID=1434886 RepID=A0ABS3XFI5_9ACTN|nr:copper resistance protein CopC [Streptomyces oryzae]MBO8194157.1 copper resistance protein CopC [Streptomyces oryzae]
MLLALVTGAVALLAVLAGAGPAGAHAALIGSDPAEGSVVRGAPRQVTLDFSEGVAMSDGAIRVLDPRGKRVDTRKVRDTGTGSKVQRAVSLEQGIGKGTYTVAWQAVSADSHPVSGAFTFSVGKPSKTSVASPQQNENAGGGAVGALYGLGRYAAYAGFVLLVGGAAFVLLCSPRAASSRAVQRLTVTGWCVLAASTLVLLLLRGPYTGSGRFADVADLGGLKDVVATKPGAALVSRLLLLAAAALFVSVLFGAYARRGGEDGRSSPEPPDDLSSADLQEGSPEEKSGAPEAGLSESGGEREEAQRQRRDLFFGLSLGGTVVAAGLAATWAMAEHASTGIQTGLAMPVDVLHLLAVALWLGGLAALFCLLRWGPAPSGTTVRRFSRLAFSCVTVLAATGLYQSWRQVGSWSALTGTSYGQLLIVKVVLVAALVTAGWFSRRWTTRLTDVPVMAENAGRSGESEGAAASASSSASVSARAAAVPGSRAPERATVRTSAQGSGGNGSDGNGSGSGGGGEGPERTPSDPVRAAQLARQRAAAEAARRRQEREADPQRSGLRRSVLTEATVAVVLLAVTTLLTGTEPGRTEERVRQAGSAAQSEPAGPVDVKVPFDTGGPDGKGTAELEIDPGTSGENALELRTTSPSGKPVEAREVKVAFTLRAKDLGPLPAPLEPVKGEKGHWKATGLQLPMAGKWKVAVTIRTSDIDQVTETTTATIG